MPTDHRHQTDSPSPIMESGHTRSEFKDADHAYNFARRLDDEDKKTLSPKRRQIMAMKYGYAPWPAASRKGGQSNLNFLEGEQALDTRRIPYIRRLAEAQSFFDFDLKKDLPPELLDDYVRDLGSCASATMRLWRGHYQQFLRAITDMIDFGLGIAMWPDSVDPRFKRIPRWDVFFEADAEPVVEDLEVVVVRDKWKPRRILEAIDHPDAAKLGFDKRNLRDTLAHLARTQGAQKMDEGKMEELEQDIRQNQYGATALPPMTVYQVLFRDLDTGKINLYVVAQISRPQPNGENQPHAIYLRKSKGAYDAMSNVLALFPLPSADTIQGLRGHGHRITPKAVASSRAKNLALDNHAFETSRLFAGQSESGNMRMQIRKNGPFTIIPPEIAPVTLPKLDVIGLDSFAIGFLNEELRKGLSGNPLTRNPETSSSPQAHRSKFQEQADLLDDNGLSEVEIGTFDFYLDACLTEFYRRLTLPKDSGPGDDLRKFFRDQIAIYDLPYDVWKNPGEGAVRAWRSIGSGSVMDQLFRGESLLKIAGSLGERGAHEVLEFYLSIIVGPRNVRRFLKEFERLGGKTEQHWVASVETSLALQGLGILRPIGDQKDDSHLRQHLEGVQEPLQLALQGEMDLQGLIAFVTALDILLPHMDHHLGRIEADQTKKVQFKEAKRAVEELRRNYNSLKAIAEQGIEAEQAEAQRQAEEAMMAQQGPQLTPEEQHKLLAKEAEHEQKMAQRGENFGRIQEERETAHQLGEQRKTAATLLAEQRKDAAALREQQRKDFEKSLEVERKTKEPANTQ